MGRKAKYVDKDRLAYLVEMYVRSNPNDTGAWLDKYERVMKTRCRNDPARWEQAKSFVRYRRRMYASPRPTDMYGRICDELVPILYKIITGRLAGMRIFGDQDKEQEAMLSVLKYVNRWDWRRKTSPLAYITEIVTQAVNLCFKNEQRAYLDGLLVLECDLEHDTRTVDELREGGLWLEG